MVAILTASDSVDAWHTFRSKHPLVVFCVRRVIIGVALLLVVASLVFFALNLLPGDAAQAMLGPRATPAQLAAVRHELGLDRPLYDRYGAFVGQLLHGSLGNSLTARSAYLNVSGSNIGVRSVSSIIAGPVQNSLVLGLLAVAIVIPLSLVLGVLAGTRPGSLFDRLTFNATLVGLSVPDFIVGMVLILIFAVHWPLWPPTSLLPPGENPLTQPNILVLPVATLVIVATGFTTRQVRAGVARVMASEYIEMARLDGIPERQVTWRWGLRNALAPAIQSFAQMTGALLGGFVLVEFVFGYPGIGYGFVQYVANRDLPTVQAVAILIAGTYITLNIIADLLVILLVPRLRTAQ